MSELDNVLSELTAKYAEGRNWRLKNNMRVLKMYQRRKFWRMIRIYARCFPRDDKQKILDAIETDNLFTRTSRLEKEIDRRTQVLIDNCTLKEDEQPDLSNHKHLLYWRQIVKYWLDYYSDEPDREVKCGLKMRAIKTKMKKD